MKTIELSCGQGLGFCPASADLSAAHKGRINTIQRQSLEKTEQPNQGSLSLLEMEKVANEKDKEHEVLKMFLLSIGKCAGHICASMQLHLAWFIT